MAEAHEHDRFYRRRLRWVRARWLTCGVVLGIVAGVLLTLGASIMLAKRLPAITDNLPGQSNVSVAIGEGYLNREAAVRIDGSYDTGVPGVTVTALRIDLAPGNRMDLQPTFRIAIETFLGPITFDVNAQVSNTLSVQGERLVINMVGDPQIGELQVPLEVLPFNLKDVVTQSVDRINNDLLISEINAALQAGFGGTNFAVEGVSTGESELTVRLGER